MRSWASHVLTQREPSHMAYTIYKTYIYVHILIYMYMYMYI